MDRTDHSKLNRIVTAAREFPKPILNKSIAFVIEGLVAIRESLEEQPHTSFKLKTEKTRELSRPVKGMTPPPFRHRISEKIQSNPGK